MTRPRKTSAGSALRDALARNRANDAVEQQNARDTARNQAEKTLSSWFNQVAANLPAQIQQQADIAAKGARVETQLSYSVPAETLRGTEGVQIEDLQGFKNLDKVCRDLDVECTVTQGRHGYGRKINAGQPYTHVTVDAEKPYTKRAVEKPQPRRNGRFR